MDSNHRMTESESVALPLGEAPIMAGVDGIKPPSADLESAVLLTELNSLKGVPVNRQELHLRGKYSAYLRLRDTGIKATRIYLPRSA